MAVQASIGLKIAVHINSESFQLGKQQLWMEGLNPYLINSAFNY